MGRDITGVSLSDQIFNIQQKLIKDIAQKEPCVIVGRCADYILSDRDDVLNVFIEGNKPEKAARIKKLYQKSDDEVKKLLKDVDKKRSVNYRYFTDKEWGNRKNYDLVLNLSLIHSLAVFSAFKFTVLKHTQWHSRCRYIIAVDTLDLCTQITGGQQRINRGSSDKKEQQQRYAAVLLLSLIHIYPGWCLL